IPERAYSLRVRYRQAVNDLCHRLSAAPNASSSMQPSLNEIASQIGVSADRVQAVELLPREVSAYCYLDNLVTSRECGSDPHSVGEKDIELVIEALARLSPFEAWVIRERYGLDAIPIGQRDRSNFCRRAFNRNATENASTSRSIETSEKPLPQRRTYSNRGR